MRRFHPAVTLGVALMAAAAATRTEPAHAQTPAGMPSPSSRPSLEAPEAPEALSTVDPMAAARAPRHLLRNGQDYLNYGEYMRALALFREAEARQGELNPAEQQTLREAIETARQGLRTPEGTASAPSGRRPDDALRSHPGAIALAEPPAPEFGPDPGPVGSPDGVLLTGAVQDDGGMPMLAPPPPEALEAAPATLNASSPPALPVFGAAPAAPTVAPPVADEPRDAITLPPLPAGAAEALSRSPASGRPGSNSAPAPPAELPPLPPPVEELLVPIGPDAPSSPPSAPAPAPNASATFPSDRNGYRDLLSPEQREEILQIVRRQEEENRGLLPPPIDEDPMTGRYDDYEEDRLGGSGIELPRAPSPTEIRPIEAIPVPEDYVPLPPRVFSPSRKYWAAAATCHAPLYFQDAVLERYGQSVEQKVGPIGRFLSYPLDDPRQSRQRNQIAQPLFSAALFASQIVLWPYNAIMDPPSEAEYDLGYYRPGDRVPPDLIYLPVSGVGPPLRGMHY